MHPNFSVANRTLLHKARKVITNLAFILFSDIIFELHSFNGLQLSLVGYITNAVASFSLWVDSRRRIFFSTFILNLGFRLRRDGDTLSDQIRRRRFFLLLLVTGFRRNRKPTDGVLLLSRFCAQMCRGVVRARVAPPAILRARARCAKVRAGALPSPGALASRLGGGHGGAGRNGSQVKVILPFIQNDDGEKKAPTELQLTDSHLTTWNLLSKDLALSRPSSTHQAHFLYLWDCSISIIPSSHFSQKKVFLRQLGFIALTWTRSYKKF